MGRSEVTAGEMVTCVLVDLAGAIDGGVTAALADEPDAVHQLRTSVRRMRNLLAAFSDMIDPGAAGALRAGLATYGDRLGRARDLEVRAADCAAAAQALGLAPLLAGRLAVPLREAHARAHADLVTWFGSPQAAELMVVLARAGEMPVVHHAGRPARVVAGEVVLAQADRTLALADDYLTDANAAHSLRKAGRRLRHVADAVSRKPASVLGKDAARLGKAGAELQSLLGDHRDAHLLADYVREFAAEASDAPSCVALVAYAEKRAADALAAVPVALEDLAGLRDAFSSDVLPGTASS